MAGLEQALPPGHRFHHVFEVDTTIDFVERELLRTSTEHPAVAAVIEGDRQWYLVWAAHGDSAIVELATNPPFDADLGWKIPKKNRDELLERVASAFDLDLDELADQVEDANKLFLAGEELHDVAAWQETLSWAKQRRIEVPSLVLCHLNDGPRRHLWADAESRVLESQPRPGDSWQKLARLANAASADELFARLMYPALFNPDVFMEKLAGK